VATVAGPQSLLAGLDSVTTSPVSLDGHAFSFQERVPIAPPDPLVRVLEPSVVVVSIPMDTPGLPREGEQNPADPPGDSSPPSAPGPR
jgi:hypothetical protein